MLFSLIGKRLLQLFFVIWAIGTLTFIITNLLPGNAAYRIAASRYGYDQVDSAAAAAVAQQLGIDQAWYLRYIHWLGDLLQFKLGNSLVSERPVWEEISHQFTYTFNLAVIALLLSLLIGISLGLLTSLKLGGWFDKLMLIIATGLRSLPAFIIGIGVISIFALSLRWLPAAGYGKASNYILPALTLALGMSAVAMRVVAQATQQVKATSYYHFGKLKGLNKGVNFVRHGIRNLAIPILNYYAVQFIYLVEGIVVVESLFAWPGIGHAMVHAVMARDVTMIQGTALLMGFMFVGLNLLVDLVNLWLDPRSRTAQEVVNV